MRTLEDQLAQYAAHHRDPRNIATHFVGVPMIFVAVTILLSRPVWPLGLGPGWALSPALLVAAWVGLYYLWLDRPLGALMALLLAAALALGAHLARQDTATWLGWGLGLFALGWVIQFIGHAWEGRKPAFVDDLIGLFIGPLFVVAEALFLLGLRRPLQQAVTGRAGPVRRRVAAPAGSAGGA